MEQYIINSVGRRKRQRQVVRIVVGVAQQVRHSVVWLIELHIISLCVQKMDYEIQVVGVVHINHIQ